MSHNRSTDRLLAEIRRSHDVLSYVDATSPTGETSRIPAVDGEVSVDRTAAVRRAFHLTCVDPLGTLTPSGSNSLLTPFGTELRPYRGVVYEDGTSEVMPLGVFLISRVTVDENTDGSQSLKIDSFDRSRKVARSKFTKPYVVTAGTNVVTAIKNIIGRTFPNVTYDALSTPMVTTSPIVLDAGDDPWEAVSDMAAAIGCDVYFDVDGEVVIAPPVDVDSMPAANFTYIEGEGNTMTDLSRRFTDEPGYNGVIVTGESVGDAKAPVRAEAWDDEPTSATYRFGPYGEVPMFVTDNLIKTTAEAFAAASQRLRNHLGFASQLDVTSTVNPAMEAGGVIEVVRARSHVSGLYSVDAFNVPLRADGTQSLTLRRKRNVGDVL